MSEVKLITRKTFRTKLGGISNTTFWRYKNKDPNFPKPKTIGGGIELYDEPIADEYILSLPQKQDTQ